MMAATAIAHRVGKPAFVQELLKTAQPDHGDTESEARAQAEEISEMVLSRPMGEVQEYFALFYRGFQSQDVKGAEALIRRET